jgi:hypothetical protein
MMVPFRFINFLVISYVLNTPESSPWIPEKDTGPSILELNHIIGFCSVVYL